MPLYRVVFFNWSALKMTKCQITCKSLQKSSKCQNFQRVWHLVIFRADQLKKPPCMRKKIDCHQRGGGVRSKHWNEYQFSVVSFKPIRRHTAFFRNKNWPKLLLGPLQQFGCIHDLRNNKFCKDYVTPPGFNGLKWQKGWNHTNTYLAVRRLLSAEMLEIIVI